MKKCNKRELKRIAEENSGTIQVQLLYEGIIFIYVNRH